jgi:putative ABC transport system permease protein
MLESLTLTFIAGFVGLFIGLLVLVGMESVIPPSEGFANPTISFTMTLITILVIIIAGLLSGILPAMNSIKIKPIDAIRDE